LVESVMIVTKLITQRHYGTGKRGMFVEQELALQSVIGITKDAGIFEAYQDD
jgi:hypothetical protein